MATKAMGKKHKKANNFAKDDLRLFPPVSRNDFIAYASLATGCALGSGLFFGLTISLFAYFEAPAGMLFLLLLAIPSLIAPALFFAYARNSVILFDSPRGLPWVVGSVVTQTAKYSFLSPLLVMFLPFLLVCSLVRGKVRNTGKALATCFDSFSSLRMPAH